MWGGSSNSIFFIEYWYHGALITKSLDFHVLIQSELWISFPDGIPDLTSRNLMEFDIGGRWCGCTADTSNKADWAELGLVGTGSTGKSTGGWNWGGKGAGVSNRILATCENPKCDSNWCLHACGCSAGEGKHQLWAKLEVSGKHFSSVSCLQHIHTHTLTAV